MNIYIANLDSTINDEFLKELFSTYGEVTSAEVAYDVFTGKSRGFGHVELENDAAGQEAINELNNSKIRELIVSVQQAAPKQVHKGSYKVGSGLVNTYRFKKN